MEYNWKISRITFLGLKRKGRFSFFNRESRVVEEDCRTYWDSLPISSLNYSSILMKFSVEETFLLAIFSTDVFSKVNTAWSFHLFVVFLIP